MIKLSIKLIIIKLFIIEVHHVLFHRSSSRVVSSKLSKLYDFVFHFTASSFAVNHVLFRRKNLSFISKLAFQSFIFRSAFQLLIFFVYIISLFLSFFFLFFFISLHTSNNFRYFVFCFCFCFCFVFCLSLCYFEY